MAVEDEQSSLIDREIYQISHNEEVALEREHTVQKRRDQFTGILDNVQYTSIRYTPTAETVPGREVLELKTPVAKRLFERAALSAKLSRLELGLSADFDTSLRGFIDGKTPALQESPTIDDICPDGHKMQARFKQMWVCALETPPTIKFMKPL